MRGVWIVAAVLCGCATNYDVYDAQRMIERQVYASQCAPLRDSVLKFLTDRDQQVSVYGEQVLETAWSEQRGSTYRQRYLVQLIEADGPTCRVVGRRGVRSPNAGPDGDGTDKIQRAYDLERELMRLHDPEAYAALPVVEFW